MNDTTGEYPREPGLKEEARKAAHAAGEEYEEVREQIREGVEEAVESGKRHAKESAEEQQYQIGESIQAIANALQAGVDSLRAQGQDTMADYCHTAVDGVDDLAKRVKGKPLEQMWEEAEHYVREQPGLAFGGAVAAGFLLSRVLKSSSPARTASSTTSSPYRATAAPQPRYSAPAPEPDYPGPLGG